MSSKTQTTGPVKQFYFNPSTGTYIPIAAAAAGINKNIKYFHIKNLYGIPRECHNTIKLQSLFYAPRGNGNSAE